MRFFSFHIAQILLTEDEINNYNDYLNQLLIQQDDINVFLPKIYSGDSLYSPGLFFIKGFHFRKLSDGINKHRLYTAITSGMFLRLKWKREAVNLKDWKNLLHGQMKQKNYQTQRF